MQHLLVIVVNSSRPEEEGASTNVVGYFDVYFIGVKESLYRDSCSIVSGLSQQSILLYHLPDEETERMYEIQDIVDTYPEDTLHLFEENPAFFCTQFLMKEVWLVRLT